MPRPGRPRRTALDHQVDQGRYLIARSNLTRRLGRAPTLVEIAHELEVSERTVDTIVARLREARRAMYRAATGLELVDPIELSDTSVHDETTRELYALGQIDTSEAMHRLGMDPDDETARRELRRWRTRLPPDD